MNLLFHIILIGILLSSNSIYARSFLLEGTITNIAENTTIELSYTILKENKWIRIDDSAKVINGKFSFQGDIEETTFARLDFPNRMIHLYIEPTHMRLFIDTNKPHRYRLTGTKVESENIEFRKQLQPYMEYYYELIDSINSLSRKNDQLKKDSPIKDLINYAITNVDIANEANHKQMNKIHFDFAAKHPSFEITPNLLSFISGMEIPIDSIRNIYNSLPAQNRNSMMGKLAHKEIEEQAYKDSVLTMTSIGNFPPDFIRKSASGDTIRLSDYKNKTYVLLDFWASWCKPCLKEIPQIKEIHKKYSNRGLTIISISLDTDEKSWHEALQKNGLNAWPQILSSDTDKKDNNKFGNNLAELYDYDAIPFFVLIDKTGKVIKKWEYITDQQLGELNENLK